MKNIYDLLIDIKHKMNTCTKAEVLKALNKKLEEEAFEVNIEEAIEKAKASKLFSLANIELLKAKPYQIIPDDRNKWDSHYLKIKKDSVIPYCITIHAYNSCDEGIWGYKLAVHEFEIGHPHHSVIYEEENRNHGKRATPLLTKALVELIRHLRKSDPSIKELLY